MSEQTIKVNIAGRSYPIKVKQDEEKAIREAENKINTGINKLISKYKVTDKQDLLAMVSLQLIAQQNQSASTGLINDLKEIEALLSGQIAE